MTYRSMQRCHVGVVGGGAWGSALAAVAARAGHSVLLWARQTALVETMNAYHRNDTYLPGIMLPDTIIATTNLKQLQDCSIVLIVTPAQTMRTICKALQPILHKGTPILICAKGIEQTSGMLMSQVLESELPHMIPAVLSGPSFAQDVASNRPTAVTIAASDLWSKKLANKLYSANFRPYVSQDLIGVQIGGALKNVLAIACGIVEGRRLGASAKAALIARGFAELARFGKAYGAQKETLMGLSGLGDLVLTCSTAQSRNFAYGVAIGRDEEPPQKLVEGVYTAAITNQLADKKGIDLPICRAIESVITGGKNIDEAVESLLMRPLQKETR